MVFEKYDDKEKARKIWQDSLKDIKQFGLGNEACNIRDKCKKADELDVRLDQLVTSTESRLRGTAAVSSYREDIDSNGSYSNARKILEG